MYGLRQHKHKKIHEYIRPDKSNTARPHLVMNAAILYGGMLMTPTTFYGDTRSSKAARKFKDISANADGQERLHMHQVKRKKC